MQNTLFFKKLFLKDNKNKAASRLYKNCWSIIFVFSERDKNSSYAITSFPLETGRKLNVHLGQSIEDKFMKLSQIDFSMELKYFTADFSRFSSTKVKNCVIVDRLGTHHQIQVFKGFS